MASYPFSLITLEGKLYKGDVEAVTVPGESGSLGILADHAQMIAALHKGTVKVTDASGEQFFVVSGGVCEVRSDETVLLCDKAQAVKSESEAAEVLAGAFAEI